MWGRDTHDPEVICVACGETLSRSEAREYDKHGDRWDRADKEFEHLCKPCYRGLCHHPRADLEELLVEIDDEPSREAFLSAYTERVRDRYDSAER